MFFSNKKIRELCTYLEVELEGKLQAELGWSEGAFRAWRAKHTTETEILAANLGDRCSLDGPTAAPKRSVSGRLVSSLGGPRERRLEKPTAACLGNLGGITPPLKNVERIDRPF